MKRFRTRTRPPLLVDRQKSSHDWHSIKNKPGKGAFNKHPREGGEGESLSVVREG